MRNLISANIRRLLKTSYFWIAVIFMAGTALFAFIMHYRDYKLDNGSPYFDSLLTIIAPIVFFAIAVFVSLFIGSEYSDGTMRNKIIAGHGRTSVYLSLVITSIVGGWILAAVWSVFYLVPSVIFMESSSSLIMYGMLYLTLFLLLAAMSAICTFVSILIGSKAAAAVVCLLLVMALMFQGVVVRGWLDEPEYYSSDWMIVDDSGTMQMGEPVPNLNYMPEGSLERNICEFLMCFMPGGQSIQIMGSLDEMARFCVYDLAWIFVLSTVGILVFRRKDLK